MPRRYSRGGIMERVWRSYFTDPSDEVSDEKLEARVLPLRILPHELAESLVTPVLPRLNSTFADEEASAEVF